MPTRTSPAVTAHARPNTVEARVLVPHLDDAVAAVVAEKLCALDAAHRPNVLRLDFGAVERVGAVALSMLVRLTRLMDEDGGHLLVQNVRPDVRRVFQLGGLDDVLDLRPDDGRAPARLSA